MTIEEGASIGATEETSSTCDDLDTGDEDVDRSTDDSDGFDPYTDQGNNANLDPHPVDVNDEADLDFHTVEDIDPNKSDSPVSQESLEQPDDTKIAHQDSADELFDNTSSNPPDYPQLGDKIQFLD
jgi:hypothetical protein